MGNHRTYRSLFWPLLLVGIGLIWLLGNLGLIPAANLWSLVRLWPLLLIAAGLELLFGRLPVIGALIALGIIAIALVMLVVGPQLGLVTESQLKTERFSEPVGQARSASITLGFPIGVSTVGALSASQNLIEAEVTHSGQLQFEASGETQKTIGFRYSRASRDPFSFLTDMGQHRWDIRFSPDVPLDLLVNVSSGQSTLDLSELQLSGLDLNISSGTIDASLPALSESYDTNVNISSGNLQIEVEEGASVQVEVRISSGNLTLEVPQGAALQVDVREKSSGSVRLPAGLEEVRSNSRGEGIWQTPGFEEGGQVVILLVRNMSSGNVSVRTR